MAEELNAVGKLASRYSEKPVIRSLLQLIPGWSSADTLLQRRADEIRADRIKAFFDELAKGQHELTEDVIESEDFLHCYFCTLRAAINTRQREKIRLLARLLESSLVLDEKASTDEYEELLTVLDSVTLREFSILRALHNYETEHPQGDGENELQNAWHYWDKFRGEAAKALDIPDASIPTFMAKIERTGLYLRITGGFLDYSGDVGRTTPLFGRLLRFLEENRAQQSVQPDALRGTG